MDTAPTLVALVEVSEPDVRVERAEGVRSPVPAVLGARDRSLAGPRQDSAFHHADKANAAFVRMVRRSAKGRSPRGG
jgi:hypothetical protein